MTNFSFKDCSKDGVLSSLHVIKESDHDFNSSGRSTLIMHHSCETNTIMFYKLHILTYTKKLMSLEE